MWVLIPIFYGLISGWLIGWTYIPGYPGANMNCPC